MKGPTVQASWGRPPLNAVAKKGAGEDVSKRCMVGEKEGVMHRRKVLMDHRSARWLEGTDGAGFMGAATAEDAGQEGAHGAGFVGATTA